MVIVEATDITDELIDAFARLVPQLDPGGKPPEWGDLAEIITSRNAVLFLAREGDERSPIIGTATLAWYRTPVGVHFWIDDVVVDRESRRMGVGEALVQAALDRARSLGAKRVDLTSNPSRESANRLYHRMGFELRTTNVYRYSLED